MRLPTRVPDVIAHRGASGYEPENTMAAFDLALEQGADVLELDVRATADGQLVTVHDPTLMRTTSDPRRVDEVTGDAIAELDHPAAPARLEDALERYGDRTRYLVDLKEPSPAWEHQVVEVLDRHGLRDRAAIQSFDLTALARLHEQDPDLSLTALYRRADSVELDVDEIPSWASGVGAWHPVIDAAFVARARARDLAIRPWTIDEPEDAERLLALGVDGLITNVPDVISAVTRGASALPEAA